MKYENFEKLYIKANNKETIKKLRIKYNLNCRKTRKNIIYNEKLAIPFEKL